MLWRVDPNPLLMLLWMAPPPDERGAVFLAGICAVHESEIVHLCDMPACPENVRSQG